VVGAHDGSELYTVGQKAKIGGAPQKYFIARKFSEISADSQLPAAVAGSGRFRVGVYPVRKGDVYVCAGADHVALKSSVLEASLDTFNWVAGSMPEGLTGTDSPSLLLSSSLSPGESCVV
jgi:hypothetical protein